MPVRLRLLLAALAVLVAAATGATAHAGPRTTSAPETITIAVVDTGVDVSHPDLAGKLVTGYDVATGTAPTSDAGWHGTAVASIAAGTPDNGLGITSYCWQCSVMPVKVLDANGQGSDKDIARGIRWAVDHGARVVNLSLEGPTEDPALPAAIRYASRHRAVVVAAAGNDGSSDRAHPAADPLAIGVAATDPSDRLYPWSNRGRWVTVAAPGINVSAVPGGGFFRFQGTSSAAALVSGVAGLCLTVAPNLTPALVRRALVAGAAPIAGASFGRIDASRTVALCRSFASSAG
ncbi:MAG: S8 family serine peptidase [Gaiellaceae bacterium]